MILEGFIGLLKGLVSLLDLLKLFLLGLELSSQLFGIGKFLASGRSEKAMRMGFAVFITLIFSRLSLFLFMIYDFDCMRLINFIVRTTIMHIDM